MKPTNCYRKCWVEGNAAQRGTPGAGPGCVGTMVQTRTETIP